MTSDNRVQSRKTRTAVSTDPTSTDGSYDETRSAPYLPRKEHSGDSNTVSKFVEAMNNPDWRRRREDNSAYNSMATTSSNPVWSSLDSGESFQSHIDKDVSISHSKNRRPCPWDFCDSANYWRSCLDSSEIGTRDTNVAPVDEGYASINPYNTHTALNKTPEEDIHGLCVLLDNTEIINAPKDVRILRLAPLFSGEGTLKGSDQVVTEDGRVFPVAHIQRTRGRLPRWKASGDGIESLSMATNEESRTHLSSSHRSSEARYRAMRSSGDENIERARDAVFQDPAVADIGNRVAEPHEKTEAVPLLGCDGPRAEDALTIRNRAFKKILKKLQETQENQIKKAAKKVNKETHQGNGGFKKLLNRLQPESGRETRYPGATPSEEHHCQPELSQPHRVLQQGKDISSDYEIISTYTNYPKKKEWSQDSGFSMGTSSPNSALNPRAREFLSFKNFTRASTSSDNTRISDEEFFRQICLDKGSEESGCLVNQPVEAASTNLNHQLPFVKPDCFNKGDKGNTSSEASSIPVGGQGPAGFDITSDMLSFSDVAFPFGACQDPMQSMASPGLLSSLGLVTPIGKWPSITGFGNQLNLPTANLPFQSCAVAPNPLVGINTTPQLPYNPTLGSSGYSPCPPPVSKPTLPDPIHQQQYEEYIEWRKANEPGYALACKSRQQRRAQRGSTLPHTSLGKVPHSEGQLV